MQICHTPDTESGNFVNQSYIDLELLSTMIHGSTFAEEPRNLRSIYIDWMVSGIAILHSVKCI